MASCNVDNNMLMKQQQTTNQINELLAQSSQALVCGPGTECERTKKSEDLQQKYLAAQTNVQSASYQEDAAEKEFYTYTQGDAAYNSMKTQRLQTDAEKKSNEIQSSFNENVNKAIELNDTLSSLTNNYQNVLELYNNYVEENGFLREKINYQKTDIITNDRKTYYEIQNYQILKSWYVIWRWIYFILLVGFGLGIFLTKSAYSIWAKLGLFALFAIYPYVIDYVVFYLLKVGASFISLLPKNIYTTL
jgi:hypothetical protein